MDTNVGALSNHHAIVLQISIPNSIVLNPTTNKLNWKHADKDEFTEAQRKTIEEDREYHNHVVSNILHYGKQSATLDKLDRAMEHIQLLLKKAAKISIQECRICNRSKPW